jgi:hypothetical protein
MPDTGPLLGLLAANSRWLIQRRNKVYFPLHGL